MKLFFTVFIVLFAGLVWTCACMVFAFFSKETLHGKSPLLFLFVLIVLFCAWLAGVISGEVWILEMMWNNADLP